jgi:capsular exopolysaccharide synthesis family protein
MTQAIRTQPQPAPAPAASGMGVDPVKLILRNKWLLAGSLIAGLAIGGVSHFAFLWTYPMFRPRALFECFPPETSPWVLTGGGGTVSNEEVSTFMQTQVRIMTSEELVQAVVDSQKLRDIAPGWANRFKKSDGQYDTTKMFSYFEDDVRAKVLPQTRLIELTFTWRKPEEAAEIVRLVMNEYMDRVRRVSDQQFKERTDALNKTIDDAKREVLLLQAAQANLIRDKKVDSVDQRLTEANIRLELVNRKLTELTGQQKDIETRIKIRETQKNHESGIPQIPEEIKARVSRDPFITSLQQDITALTTSKEGLQLAGLQPTHKQIRALESRLQAARAQLVAKQEELWAQEFESELNEMKNLEESLKQQILLSASEAADLRTRQTELAGVLTTLDEMRAKIGFQQQGVQSATEKLRDLNVMIAQPTAARIVARQRDIRVPKEPFFPKLIFMIPAGGLLLLGLTGGVVVLREVLDQRIKGPGDIGLIPRTRLLGWVADASEDPAGPGVVETAFRDRPRGVLAENFRQIRSSLLKKMEVAGHKTVLVAGCMPSSGSTSVAANLAIACAASGKNVLLIDANFRRPAMHRVFGISEGPGLGDVLAGDVTLDAAAQSLKDIPTMKVLSTGPSSKRVYESLASDKLGEVLSLARTKYDCVFIDVAPAVVSGDAASIANRTDASILVARTFAEKRGMIARVKNELSEARGEFFGVIVNGVKSAAGGYLKGNIKASHEYQSEPEVKA